MKSRGTRVDPCGNPTISLFNKSISFSENANLITKAQIWKKINENQQPNHRSNNWICSQNQYLSLRMRKQNESKKQTPIIINLPKAHRIFYICYNH